MMKQVGRLSMLAASVYGKRSWKLVGQGFCGLADGCSSSFDKLAGCDATTIGKLADEPPQLCNCTRVGMTEEQSVNVSGS